MPLRPLHLPLLCALLCSVQTTRATDWYVSGTGSDDKPGTSAETAFRSLQKAADNVQPGDTVLVGDGVYTDPGMGDGSSVLRIKRSGRADAWITWKAVPGTHPELRPTGWNGINIEASYLIFDGLTVTGDNDAIVFAQALADEAIKEKNGKKYAGDPRFNTNGIFINGRTSSPENKPHHVIVRHCVVSKCPGGGLTGIEADYLTFEDNLIFDNAWFMRYGGSGITTLTNWAFDDAPGYHIIIQRNQVWNNKTNVPWSSVHRLSDGNGILLDVSDIEESAAQNPNGDTAQNPNGDTSGTPAASATPTATPKPPRPEWKGRSLIANNLSAFNGGSGIHTFRHKHADIINNTTYWNGGNVGYPELFANRSDDIVILNNIIVPRPRGAVTSNSNNSKNINNRWDYNVYPDKQTVVTGEHDVVGDPMFVKIARDLRDADFRLRHGSPALDSGTDELPQPKDVLGVPRPQSKGRDRGAFEQ